MPGSISFPRLRWRQLRLTVSVSTEMLLLLNLKRVGKCCQCGPASLPSARQQVSLVASSEVTLMSSSRKWEGAH